MGFIADGHDTDSESNNTDQPDASRVIKVKNENGQGRRTTEITTLNGSPNDTAAMTNNDGGYGYGPRDSGPPNSNWKDGDDGGSSSGSSPWDSARRFPKPWSNDHFFPNYG